MKHEKKTEILIEVERVRVVRRSSSQHSRIWCAECGAEAEFVTAPQAAALDNSDIYSIFERAERGAIHASMTPARILLVCLNSLLNTGESPDALVN